MAEDKKPSIFQKIVDVSTAVLDAQIAKAQTIVKESNKTEATKEDPSDFNFGKAVTRDVNFYTGSQGYQEKVGQLSFEYLRQMSIKNSIVAAIIKTRQNRVASHSEYLPQGNGKGFKIVLKNEQEELDKLKLKMFPDTPVGIADGDNTGGMDSASFDQDKMQKGILRKGEMEPGEIDPAELAGLAETDPNEIPEEPLSDQDKDRQAKEALDEKTKKKKQYIADFIQHCGELEDRPFETKKWNFDAYLRAIVWDSLTYDQIGTELVPKEAENLNGKFNVHHFQPVDGSTIRYASPELSKYKTPDMHMAQDILYPEEELKALEERDALTLDEGRLENHEYKYVQVVRGRIQRAFTENEMKVGMRNPITDLYSNGYALSELELLVALVSSHLQTEYYNRSYFQQGFSAKGILHIKANLNRTKLEELRRHWNHMVKGNKNSFQTPIMAGMDEVEWIPLTQSHSEMEFSLWLNYLIRMICSIYQIDPSEIGYGMKDAGGSSGMSGDNTKEKLQNSKDKGFVPLMKFFQTYINHNIVENIDSDYKLEWVGLEEESETDKIARQKEEVQYKKSLNEIRAEDGLPPIKGADNLILNPVYFQWFGQFSEEGKKMMQDQQAQMMAQQPQEQDPKQAWEAEEAGKENEHQRGMESKMFESKIAQSAPVTKSLRKSQSKKPKAIKIEYYR